MAGSVRYDLEGSQYSAGLDGNRWSRRFHATGLEALTVPELIEEIYLLLPNTGDPAPAPIGNMFLRDATVDSILCDTANTGPPSTSQAFGTLIYTTPTRVGGLIGAPDDDGPGVTLSTSSSVQEVTIRKDIYGLELETVYDNVAMAHEAQGFEVSESFTFTRLEVTNPRVGRADVHTNTLNAALWNGYDAKTVLCASIESDTDDYSNYVVTYTFTVRPDGWRITIPHEDPFFPGHPLPGATGPALLETDTIGTSDFWLLNIVL